MQDEEIHLAVTLLIFCFLRKKRKEVMRSPRYKSLMMFSCLLWQKGLLKLGECKWNILENSQKFSSEMK